MCINHSVKKKLRCDMQYIRELFSQINIVIRDQRSQLYKYLFRYNSMNLRVRCNAPHQQRVQLSIYKHINKVASEEKSDCFIRVIGQKYQFQQSSIMSIVPENNIGFDSVISKI